MKRLLASYSTVISPPLPHEAVFEKMDEAAELFGVLVIKTLTTIIL